jgi:hypothetical protein
MRVARFNTRIGGAVALVAILAGPVPAYIHFPPPTLQRMCKDSHHIRLLKVQKFDKDKGVIVFECSETLKDGKSEITAFKVLARPDTTGYKPVLEWLGDGKQAVMFSIEGQDRGALRAIAYVFIDDYCFSADHNAEGKHWVVIRGEPSLSACYHGSADKLRGLTQEILLGKDVKVPVRAPDTKEDRVKRNKEVNEVLENGRSRKR